MLSRVFAQYQKSDQENKHVCDVLRSVELILLACCFFMIFLIFLFSKDLINVWLSTSVFTTEELSNILEIFAVMIFFRLFEGIYKSTLIGMQKHITQNLIVTGVTLLKTVSLISLLLFFTSDIQVFFLVQLIFGSISTALLLHSVYSRMPLSMLYARFSLISLKKVYKFSAGLAGITLLSLFLTQFDKIILTKYISLENFGYYTLSASVASVLHILISPITISLGPKLAALQKQNDLNGFEKEFFFGSEFIGLVVCTAGGIIAVYSFELFSFWTSSSVVADKTFEIASILILGNILNSMMWMPYQAQLAYGWTRLSLMTNVFSIILLVPLNLLFVPIYGSYAAVTIWAILNAGYILIVAPIMFSKILQNAGLRWFSHCVGKPLFIGFTVPLFWKYVISLSDNLLYFIIEIGSIMLLSFSLIVISSKTLRTGLFRLEEE